MKKTIILLALPVKIKLFTNKIFETINNYFSMIYHFKKVKEEPKVILNLSNIEDLNNMSSSTLASIIKRADKYLEESPVTVVDKTASISGDKHNFEVIGSYYWPNPDTEDGLPYISKDGQKNPDSDSNKYDLQRILELKNRCYNLSVAFYLTRNLAYYDALCKLLDVWFIYNGTFMYPNMIYDGFCPGKDDNKGITLMESYHFILVIDSILLTDSIKSIGSSRKQALIKWFTYFKDWAINSENGRRTRIRNNNQTIMYDLVLLAIALFINNKEVINDVRKTFTSDIERLINSIGGMPNELRRTLAFLYSIECLRIMVEVYAIFKKNNISISIGAKDKLKGSAYYLKQFVGHKEKFIYTEIGDWERSEQRLITLINNMENLGLHPTPLSDVNEPYDPNNITLGEIGGYIIYNKNLGRIPSTLPQHLRELRLNYVFIDTVEDLTYEEWVYIFLMFKNSSVKLIIRNIDCTPELWEELLSYNVLYKVFDENSSIAKIDYSNEYSNYLENCSSTFVISEYSPFKVHNNNIVYAEGQDSSEWINYLKVFKESLISDSRLCISVGKKTITFSENDMSYLEVIPEINLLTLKMLAYATLMAGSKGFICFYMSDIPYLRKNTTSSLEISNSLFQDNFNINMEQFSLALAFFSNLKFINFKYLMTNLLVKEFPLSNYDINNFITENSDRKDLLISLATNNKWDYCTILNTSLNNTITINIKLNTRILNLEDLTSELVTNSNNLQVLKPGEIICIKKECI